MRTILATTLALAALTSAALADGVVELTDTQLDQIAAGLLVDSNHARRPADDVIDTTLARFPFLAPPQSFGARVANPGVNVSRVGNVLAIY